MNYKEISSKLENNDKTGQQEIISILMSEDYSIIKELYYYLKNNSKKSNVNNYLKIIVNNMNNIYDDEMHLNNNLSYLSEEQPLIVKYLLANNYRFSENQIKNMRNNLLILLPIDSVLEEICNRIQKKQFSLSLLILSQIKKVINYAYKNNMNQVIETMIDDYDFIIQYNNSNLDTVKLLSHSGGSIFREKIMTSSRFLAELKDNPENIAPYLSKEEVIYLETDTDIKNIFLTKGLRYDILDNLTIQNLLDNINIFKTFPFYTINEFFLAVSSKDSLLNNNDFLNIYLDKIDDIYDNINLFSILNKTYIDRLITSHPKELIYLNVFINSKSNYKEWLLTKAPIKEALFNTKRYKIYSYLDHSLLLEILKTKDSIFSYNKYFNLLEEDELKELINSPNTYNSFIKEIQDNKLSVPTINKILSIMDLSNQKRFIKNITDFFPRTLYLDFFSSNIPLFLETYRSNKNLSYIVNSFDPSQKEIIKSLLKNLNKNDLLRIKQEEIENKSLFKIIKECFSSTTSDITDLYINTPIEKLIEMLKKNETLVINLIKARNVDSVKKEIILSSDSIIKIFLDEKYIKYYDKNLLASIISNLNSNQKDKYLDDKMIKLFYTKDIIKVYNNLKEKNGAILNTLNISFLNEQTIKLKYNILEYITKYKDLQKYILLILDYVSVKDITSLFASLEGYDKEYLLPRVLKTIYDSLKGKNRKKIGNFINFFSELKGVAKEDWLNIISYLLYHIPLVPDAIKNNIVKTPSSYADIRNYEQDFYKQSNDNQLKNYKLTKEEIYYITNKYPKEYAFINELNYSNKRKDYRILEVYKELTKIKNDYTNKLYCELKNSINNLPKTSNRIQKEKYNLYTSRNRYSYLILDKSAMPFQEYINYISSVSSCFRTILLTESNTISNGVYYSFSNISTDALKDFNEDGYFLNKYSPSKNGNVLTLPDNILVVEDGEDDLSYITEAISICKEFKSYKELKIIIINKENLYDKLVEKYKREMTISNLNKCLNMLEENDYKYSIKRLLPIIMKHLKTNEKDQVKRLVIDSQLEEYYQEETKELIGEIR